MLVTNGSSPELFNRQFDFDEVSRLPQVAQSAPVSYWFGNGETASGRPLAVPDITPFAGTDGRFGTELNRAEPLDGRLPRAPDELAVSFLAAERYDIEVGDTLPLAMPGPGAFGAAGPAGPPPPVTDFRVVGVVAVQGAFPPLSTSGSIPPLVLLSEAFAEGHPDAAEVLAVRLHGGRSDVSAFTAELERLAPGTQVITLSEREVTPMVQRGLDVQATVLRVLAAVLAVVALLVAALTLQRELVLGSADAEVLAALGVTRAQRYALGAARSVGIAAGAAVVAVLTAVALSPLAPVGVARKAEFHPGLEANVALLAIGAGATVVLVALAGAVPAWWSSRAGRREAGDARPSRVGTVEPTVVEGRTARGPTEVLLGGRTLRDLGLSVGDVVPVAFGDRTARLRVVGQGVLSEFAGGAGLGEGAAMTVQGVRRLVPDVTRNVVLVRARPDAGRDALAAGLRTDYADEGVYLPEKPSDLADLERVSSLPFAVAALLGVLALATLASAVATSVRRRRRDLAVLKVLGFVRSQVRATVAWQSSTLAVVAGVVGVPLGIAAGRTAWDVFADRLGVPPRPVTPVLAVAVLVPLLVVLANAIAAVPGRVAARMPPAPALRAE